MRTFTSYVSEYDAHVGKTPMGDLPREQQDEIIRTIFEPDSEYQSYVMQHDVEHHAPDGLWTLVVAAGLYLERRRVIEDFTERTPTDRDWIINFLRRPISGSGLKRHFLPSTATIARRITTGQRLKRFQPRTRFPTSTVMT